MAVPKDKTKYLVNRCKTVEDFQKPIFKTHTDDRCCAYDHCKMCEIQKIAYETGIWFDKIKRKYQQMFLLKLIMSCKSNDTLDYLIHLLKTIDTKDAVYEDMNYRLIQPKFSKNSKSPKFNAEEVSSWFCESNVWTQTNFLLLILSHADVQLLKIIREKIQISLGVRTQTISADVNQKCSHFIKQMEEMKVSDNEKLQAEYEKMKSIARIPVITKLKEKLFKKKVKRMILPSDDNDEYKVLSSGTILYKDVVRDLLAKAKQDDSFNIQIGAYFLKRKEPVDYLDEFSWRRINLKIDFTKSLPLHLIVRIVEYLDKDSLSKCIQVGGTLKVAAEIVLKRIKQTKLNNSSKYNIQSVIIDLNPNFESNVYIHIPAINSAFEAIPKTNTTGNEQEIEFKFEDVLSNIQTRRILMQLKNVYAKNYSRCVLIKKNDLTRVIHNDGSDLIAVYSFQSPVEFYSCRTMKRVQLNLQYGYLGRVRCFQLVSHERLLFAGGNDLIVRCWSMYTGKCKQTFVGHRNPIVCLAVCSGRVAAGSTDGSTKMWNYVGEKYFFTFHDSHAITALAMNEVLCITGCHRGKIQVYDVFNGSLIKKLIHQESITCIKANRWFIVSSSCDGFVRVWSAQGKISSCFAEFLHPSKVTQVEMYFLRIITGCQDGKIRVWDLKTKRLLKYIYPTEPNRSLHPIVSFHLGNDKIVVNTEAQLTVLNFESASCTKPKTGTKRPKLPVQEEEKSKWMILVDSSVSPQTLFLMKSLITKSECAINLPPSLSLHQLPTKQASLNYESAKNLLLSQWNSPINEPIPEPFKSIIHTIRNPKPKRKVLPRSRSDTRLADLFISKQVTCRAFKTQIALESQQLEKPLLYWQQQKDESPETPYEIPRARPCQLPRKTLLKEKKSICYNRSHYVERKVDRLVKRSMPPPKLLFTTSGGQCDDPSVYLWPKEPLATTEMKTDPSGVLSSQVKLGLTQNASFII